MRPAAGAGGCLIGRSKPTDAVTRRFRTEDIRRKVYSKCVAGRRRGNESRAPRACYGAPCARASAPRMRPFPKRAGDCTPDWRGAPRSPSEPLGAPRSPSEPLGVPRSPFRILRSRKAPGGAGAGRVTGEVMVPSAASALQPLASREDRDLAAALRLWRALSTRAECCPPGRGPHASPQPPQPNSHPTSVKPGVKITLKYFCIFQRIQATLS